MIADDPTAVKLMRSAKDALSAECWILMVVFPLTVLVGTWSRPAPPLALDAALSTDDRLPRDPCAIEAPVVSWTPDVRPKSTLFAGSAAH